MLHSGSGGQGCPLATGPSGLASEPKAPGKAWREDARQTLGLSTDTADVAARTTHRQTLGLSTGRAGVAANPLTSRVPETLTTVTTHSILLHCAGCGYTQFQGVQEIIRRV